jgi:hypothetical protein
VNDVKEICAVMLAEPEPPMRSGPQAWAHAHRATQRRAARRWVGTGGAGLAAVVAAALVASGLLGAGQVAAPGGGPGAGPGPGPDGQAAAPVPNMVAAAQTTLPDLPTPALLEAHGTQLHAILTRSAPSGYRAERRWDGPIALWYISLGQRPEFRQSEPPVADLNGLAYFATASVALEADGREGDLSAYVVGDHRPVPTGDLCSAEVNERLHRILGPPGSCQVITVGGMPMRVTTKHDPEELFVIEAIWFVRNGFVTVRTTQGVPDYKKHADGQRPPDAPAAGGQERAHRPPLAQPPFTPEQVASIAANPDLLP